MQANVFVSASLVLESDLCSRNLVDVIVDPRLCRCIFQETFSAIAEFSQEIIGNCNFGRNPQEFRHVDSVPVSYNFLKKNFWNLFVCKLSPINTDYNLLTTIHVRYPNNDSPNTYVTHISSSLRKWLAKESKRTPTPARCWERMVVLSWPSSTKWSEKGRRSATIRYCPFKFF